MNLARLVGSGAWLTLSSIVNNLFGYIYWLLVSAIAGPETLGHVSATVGLASLASAILSLGVPAALQRHIAACRGERGCIAAYYWTAMAYTVAVSAAATVILYTLGLTNTTLASYTRDKLVAAAAALLILATSSIPFSHTVATMNTKLVFKTTLIGNTVKVALGPLLAAHHGWAGALAAYLAPNTIHIVLLTPYVLETAGRPSPPRRKHLRETLKAGAAVWLPTTITLLGQWLGVIAVYGYTGATETGHYYVAYMLANLPLIAANTVLGVLVPALASMQSGREQLAQDAMRLSLALATPVATALIAYPNLALTLLGRQYQDAAPTLQILALGTIPLIITNTIASLVYAKAQYKHQLAIGLAQNLPRITLYPALTPTLGQTGAALATTIGSLTGLAHALHTARKTGHKIDQKTLTKILAPAAATTLATTLLQPPWPIGLTLHLTLYPTYTRLGAIKRKDLQQIAQALTPREKIKTAYQKLKPLIDLLAPEH